MNLIMGKFNQCNDPYYWEVGEGIFFNNIAIGDYAIVENMNDYDLVKVIGKVVTKEKYIKFLGTTELKKVIDIIDRKDIRVD